MVPGHLLDFGRHSGKQRGTAVVDDLVFLTVREDTPPEEIEDLRAPIRTLDAATTGRIVVDHEFRVRGEV